jgi:creatinine deaminase
LRRREKLSTQGRRFFEIAIEQARAGAAEGGVPIGAALVVDEKVVGIGRNRRIQMGTVTRHAETDALEDAGRLHPDEYQRATLYTTLVPCYMCSGAVVHLGIARVVAGENRTVLGGEDLLRSHGVDLQILDDTESYEMMASFIRENPTLWYEKAPQR